MSKKAAKKKVAKKKVAKKKIEKKATKKKVVKKKVDKPTRKSDPNIYYTLLRLPVELADEVRVHLTSLNQERMDDGAPKLSMNQLFVRLTQSWVDFEKSESAHV